METQVGRFLLSRWSNLVIPLTIAEGDLLNISDEYVRFHATLLDGCISGVTVDINNPTLTIQGQILGEIHSMVNAFSKLRIAMNGEEIADQYFRRWLQSQCACRTPTFGRWWPNRGWSVCSIPLVQHRQSETIVVQIEEMNIVGGYLIEWIETHNVKHNQTNISMKMGAAGYWNSCTLVLMT